MRFLVVFAFFFFACVGFAAAQQVSIELGKSKLPINQYFTISVKLQDQELKDISAFPDIEGFKKSTKFSSTKTIIVGGKTTVILTITQNYAAFEEGEFELKPFAMKVNGQTEQAKGTLIQVLPMAAGGPQSPAPPDLATTDAEADEDIAAEQEFVDMEDNAFLTLYTSKKEIFVGEGVGVVLYFYLANEDQRLLDFHDFASQLTGILKQLKQPNVWEETFEIGEITPEQVTISDKPFLRFKLYEAVLYPLTKEPLVFPALFLKMIKYKVAKNPNLLTDDRLEGYKTFRARERNILVKELPPHPLRDVVPVGSYTLHESISKSNLAVNKSLKYQFEIEGEGNLTAIMPPVPAAIDGLEFYPSDLNQSITRRDGRITGIKTFIYPAVARQPGYYSLSDAFEWVFFNPETAAYDTLRPQMIVRITGESDSDDLILSRNLGAFYNIIENEENTLVSLHYVDKIKRYTNIVLLVLLVVSAVVFFKK
ncbi:protein BatD [Pontibacter qinzhouensis]|uniref:Protein BatD n=1 Tax=Pontibacter qinzhouensis TaxID=2603253 RepID=A0A5C8K752_9BACT|nr:BatD family protein [Pontibacter qinzhouensis]TXK44939.1 protein BatD [Pontibacter qinzhouensis]